MSDYVIKIGDVARSAVAKELIEAIERDLKPMYKDLVMGEDLYDVEYLAPIKQRVTGTARRQLNEIIDFAKKRDLTYIRFT